MNRPISYNKKYDLRHPDAVDDTIYVTESPKQIVRKTLFLSIIIGIILLVLLGVYVRKKNYKQSKKEKSEMKKRFVGYSYEVMDSSEMWGEEREKCIRINTRKKYKERDFDAFMENNIQMIVDTLDLINQNKSKVYDAICKGIGSDATLGDVEGILFQEDKKGMFT